MDTNSSEMPETLMEATAFFSQGDNAHEMFVSMRWPDGVKCPRCQSEKVCAIPTRKTWECKCCTEKKQFSVKTGTIFEESPLALAKWLSAIWLIANCKNGVSSYEIHRAIGVTQKTAWFMLHRIRAAMLSGTFEKLSGHVEADETYIGGAARFMHKDVKARRLRGGKGSAGKSIVQGFLERGGTVRTVHVIDSSKATLDGNVRANVESGSKVYTDAHSSYVDLRPEFDHAFVDHAIEYVRGQVHTNGMENFWSCLKRTLKGTYVSVDPTHLGAYLDEQVFRFNKRKLTDAARFVLVALQTVGKRITYEQLINPTANA
jgi:transposase-like protein